MNYKYVIAGADNDFYDIAFKDVRNKDKNITYLRTAMAVSYTHLDVYKRQTLYSIC